MVDMMLNDSSMRIVLTNFFSRNINGAEKECRLFKAVFGSESGTSQVGYPT
jgi:hypothetical protein